MWLELTRPNGTKELFNMALVVNISVDDNDNNRTSLWYLGTNSVDDWTTIDVVESVADLKNALGAIGKPNVL